MSILDSIIYNYDYKSIDNLITKIPKRDNDELIDNNIVFIQKLESEIKQLESNNLKLLKKIKEKKREKKKAKKILRVCQNNRNTICVIC